MPNSGTLTERFRVFKHLRPVPGPPGARSWQSLMEMALTAAKEAARHGDVPVGALVASQKGHILALAANRVERDADPSGHAEIMALRQAAKSAGSPRLDGCVLVVTLEPCAMCACAIAHARISGVVFGAWDMRAGAVQSAADLEDLPLAGRTFWHMGGVLASRCADLLNKFFISRRY